jgi:hypothetical protein
MDKSLATVANDQLLRRIRGEYLEMPGLRLTPLQAQRLWGLDEHTCTLLLESLTVEKFLCRKANGTYARIADAAAAFQPPRIGDSERAAYPTTATAPRMAIAHVVRDRRQQPRQDSFSKPEDGRTARR